MGEHNIRELVKSLQDLGVHAGSSSEVIESLKRENTELRQTRDDWIERAFRVEEQRDELLTACEYGDALRAMNGPELLRYAAAYLIGQVRDRLHEKADMEEAAITKAKRDVDE